MLNLTIRLRRNLQSLLLALGLLALVSRPVAAADLVVAVAANAAAPLEEIVRRFEAETGDEVSLVVGATGRLYAQIVNGAPFDVFLAADQERPELLEKNGHAVAGSRRTYATGRLALWVPGWKSPTALQPELYLRSQAYRHLAIANPSLAPYGRAALEVLESLGLDKALMRKLARGEDVGKAYALVASGSAPAGLIAQSTLIATGADPSTWAALPAFRHRPVRQDAVLLQRAVANPAAIRFMNDLASPGAAAIFRSYGYAGNE